MGFGEEILRPILPLMNMQRSRYHFWGHVFLQVRAYIDNMNSVKSTSFNLARNKLHKKLSYLTPERFSKLIWDMDAAATSRAQFIRPKWVPNEMIEAKIDSKYFFGRWELETLVNVYFSARPKFAPRKILNSQNPNTFLSLISNLRTMENAETFRGISHNEFMETIPRMLWRQLPWQVGLTQGLNFYRSWRIFSGPECQRVFDGIYQMNFDQIARVYFGLYASFNTHPLIHLNDFLKQIDVTEDQQHRVLDRISKSFSEFRKATRQSSNPFEQVAYQPSELRKFPVLKTVFKNQLRYLAPIADLVAVRGTNGMFYDLSQDDNARNEYARAFEAYVDEFFSFYASDQQVLQTEYKFKKGLDSPDLILCNSKRQACLIIEAKAKKVPFALRKSDAQSSRLDSYSEIRKGILQIWRYRQNKLEEDNKVVGFLESCRGLIATLDDWDVGIRIVGKRLLESAHDIAEKEGIPSAARIPVSIVPIWDLEEAISILGLSALPDLLEKQGSKEHYGWLVSQIARDTAEDIAIRHDFPWSEKLSNIAPFWSELP